MTSRRRRRGKTDKIDGEALMRAARLLSRAFRHWLTIDGADIAKEAEGMRELDNGLGFDFEETIGEGENCHFRSRGLMLH